MNLILPGSTDYKKAGMLGGLLLKGKQKAPETRIKMGNAKRNIKLTAEHRANMRKSHKTLPEGIRKGAKNPFHGKKHSPKTREKMAATIKSYWDAGRFVPQQGMHTRWHLKDKPSTRCVLCSEQNLVFAYA